jgi:hypothetical protein
LDRPAVSSRVYFYFFIIYLFFINHYFIFRIFLYITKKSCIYKSTEPDDFKWTSVFNNDLIIDANTRALFNENTRQKILTRY